MTKGKPLWLFFRSLSTMVSSGISLHVALHSISEQAQEPEVAKTARSIADGIANGRRLSTMASSFPGTFSSFHSSLLRVGEETGGLALVLKRLADHEESTTKLRSLLVARLSYPAFLFLFAVAMVLFLPAFCLEGLFQVIERTSSELPVVTTIFIGLSRFLRHPIVLVGLLILAALVGLTTRRALQSPGIQELVRRQLLRTPGLGGVFRNASMAVFADALSLQLEAGSSPLNALPIAAQASSSPLIMEDADQAVAGIRNGQTLGESLAQAEGLSPLFCSMVTVGEESGRVPHLLKKTGEFYTKEVENSLEVLAGMLEPVVMVVMGAIFALMLVATMLPLVRLVQTL